MTLLGAFHEAVAGVIVGGTVIALCCWLAHLMGDPDDSGPSKPAT